MMSEYDTYEAIFRLGWFDACQICTDHVAEFISPNGDWVCKYCAGHCCDDCDPDCEGCDPDENPGEVK